MPPKPTRQSHTDLGTRIQALSLLEYGVHWEKVVEITGVSKTAVYRLRSTAIARGYKPEESKILLLEYVIDAPKPGRPTKAKEDIEQESEEVIHKD